MQMTDPIDRSMPPAMITIASPRANSEISEMCRMLFCRLSAAEEQRVQHRGDDRQRDHHPQHRQLFLERSHAAQRAILPGLRYFFISFSSAQKVVRLLLSIFWMVVSMKVGMVLPSRTSFSAFID